MCVCVCVCVCTHMCVLSHVQLFATPWTVACQAPPSMEFSRPEYWSGLPCFPPGDLPIQGSNPHLLSQALAGGFFTTISYLPMQEMQEAVSTSGLEKYPGVGNGKSLQYSCLKNSMDGGAWQAIVYRVAKSWT